MTAEQIKNAVWWHRAYAAINERYYVKVGELGESYEQWKAMRTECDDAWDTIEAGGSDPSAMSERVQAFMLRIIEIESKEPARANLEMLGEAQDDWNEATYGPGIRTNEQVHAELNRRRQLSKESQE